MADKVWVYILYGHVSSSSLSFQEINPHPEIDTQFQGVGGYWHSPPLGQPHTPMHTHPRSSIVQEGMKERTCL